MTWIVISTWLVVSLIASLLIGRMMALGSAACGPSCLVRELDVPEEPPLPVGAP